MRALHEGEDTTSRILASVQMRWNHNTTNARIRVAQRSIHRHGKPGI